MNSSWITLNRKQILSALFAAIIAFLTYASVYAYRKPFTVATFEGVRFFDISYQTILIICQGIGYMLSKFYGIKFIAELKRLGRWKTILILIAIAWLALLGFALAPPPYGMPFLVINGFMLGFLWGIIFSYVEGRRTTDFIGSAMAVSFIFAGGFTRSVAVMLRDQYSVPEAWLGFVTGAVFLFPLLFFLFLLEKIPPPDTEDVAERTIRTPMNGSSRRALLRKFGWGLLLVMVTYVFLTVMRDVRDNFMSNMWNELGYGSRPAIFTKTETITSLVVLVLMSMLVVIRKNMLAFKLVHLVIIAGFALAGLASILFLNGHISGAWWMQLTGLGLYMGYIPYNCIFFERMIATFRIAGNVGFLIYMADAFGYLGSMLVVLSKEIGHIQLNWVHFYSNAVMLFAVLGIIGTVVSFFYFDAKYKKSD